MIRTWLATAMKPEKAIFGSQLNINNQVLTLDTEKTGVALVQEIKNTFTMIYKTGDYILVSVSCLTPEGKNDDKPSTN